MSEPSKILVVDDTPLNVKILADLLTFNGYAVATASSGAEGLAKIESEHPDLVLLDVMMPGMNGYEVCKEIRAKEATRMLPVVMVTALDPTKERTRGLEAGADDFLTKPINQPELLARVRSLLRVKQYHDQVESQAAELAVWNRTLEQRVQEQVAQIEQLSKLKRFFSPQLAQTILDGGDDMLKPHRREVTVMFLDLRGFTAFTGAAEPEEVMSVLREFHGEIGKMLQVYQGTLERFAGDGVMIFFNDPVPVPDAVEQAMRMACILRDRFKELHAVWNKLGHELDLGVGIAQGYATLGAIGYEGRWDYAAIGAVTNLAARLCGEAKPGQILTNRRTLSRVENLVEAEPLEAMTLKGFAQAVEAFNIVGLKG
jgi:adenylate cyclase